MSARYGNHVGVSAPEVDVCDATFGRAPRHLFEHVGLHVQHVQHSFAGHGHGDRKRVRADSRTDFENPLSSAWFKHANEQRPNRYRRVIVIWPLLNEPAQEFVPP